jgi:hypothetical protein
MCDLHDRLIDRGGALGARRVRIEHGGSPRHVRRHPHLTGEINGTPFSFPIKSSRSGASRGYRRACLRGLEEHLRALRDRKEGGL